MKTPYDPVVRVGTREVETLRNALRQEMARVATLAHDAAALAQRVHDECVIAEGDALLRTDGWVRARRAQAAQIELQRGEAEAGLTQLRDRALHAYGRLRSAERAASAYLDKARAEEARKAQAEADDLNTARRLLKQRRKVRARRPAEAKELVDAA